MSTRERPLSGAGYRAMVRPGNVRPNSAGTRPKSAGARPKSAGTRNKTSVPRPVSAEANTSSVMRYYLDLHTTNSGADHHHLHIPTHTLHSLSAKRHANQQPGQPGNNPDVSNHAWTDNDRPLVSPPPDTEIRTKPNETLFSHGKPSIFVYVYVYVCYLIIVYMVGLIGKAPTALRSKIHAATTCPPPPAHVRGRSGRSGVPGWVSHHGPVNHEYGRKTMCGSGLSGMEKVYRVHARKHQPGEYCGMMCVCE